MPAFGDMWPGENLDGYHQRRVVPTPEEKRSRNEEIDAFVRFLQSQFNTAPYTVARVLKSGSLGKGTAVRGSADIDLVVIINGLSSILDLRRQRRALLDRIDELSHSYRWSGRLRKTAHTPYSLTYTLNGQELDILPALNIDSVYGGQQGVYSKMNENNFQDFSASLAPLQIGFVKPKEEAVKRVIRLLKFWKKDRGVDIRSYTLELLTINAFRRTWSGTTDSVFREVLRQLADCSSIRVAFDDYYESEAYTQFRSGPYVLDPANPYMNTLHGRDVYSISREAEDMLYRLSLPPEVSHEVRKSMMPSVMTVLGLVLVCFAVLLYVFLKRI